MRWAKVIADWVASEAMRLLSWLAVFAFVLGAIPAQAQEFAPPEGRVAPLPKQTEKPAAEQADKKSVRHTRRARPKQTAGESDENTVKRHSRRSARHTARRHTAKSKVKLPVASQVPMPQPSPSRTAADKPAPIKSASVEPAPTKAAENKAAEPKASTPVASAVPIPTAAPERPPTPKPAPAKLAAREPPATKQQRKKARAGAGRPRRYSAGATAEDPLRAAMGRRLSGRGKRRRSDADRDQ